MSGRKSHGYKSVVYLPSISGEKTNPFPGNTHLVDIPLSGGIFPLQIEPSSAQRWVSLEKSREILRGYKSVVHLPSISGEKVEIHTWKTSHCLTNRAKQCRALLLRGHVTM